MGSIATAMTSSWNRRTVAITGIGLICPIGATVAAVLQSIRQGRSGFNEIRSFDTSRLRVRHAAEIDAYNPLDHFSVEQAEALDRTAQFAIIAARQAVADAALSNTLLASGRVALVMGICAGGQGDSNIPAGDGHWWSEEKLSRRFLATAHYFQTDAVAAELGVHGPAITVSTACASSTSALGIGFSLLQAGKADVVLVGGADAFSLYTYAGFYALGAMPEQPISPFSIHTGVTFGEGAGCVVLESLEQARARSVPVQGELLGCGMSGDAYHITAPHPSGEGLQRAMAAALRQANLTPAEVDYINAHGTGTQDNDVSETLAIHALYGKDTPIPPVSSSKSFFGHTLGAAGILEFIVSLLAVQHNLIPPTLNFEAPRPGCDLDYVPNQARPGHIDCFISNSAAFGGVNAAVVGGRLQERQWPGIAVDSVLITGIGIVSPLGFNAAALVAALRTAATAVGPVDRFACDDCRCRHAALVKGFQPRRLAATVDPRRMDTLTQYAVVATTLALKDAGLLGKLKPTRTGLTVALTRGPVSTQERFLHSLGNDGIEQLSAKYFPAMVLSTLSGEIAQACQLKGANFTIVNGPTAGLQALICAYEYLRQNDELDAMVVVAADEIGQLFFHLFDRLQLLADSSRQSFPRPYDPDADGLMLGEGAAALVLERQHFSHSRAAPVYGGIAGCGLTADARPDNLLEVEGRWLTAAAHLALAEAGIGMDTVAAVYGHGRGEPGYDHREVRVLSELLAGRDIPVGCVTGNLGLAEAGSGLFTVAAALLGMSYGEVYPIVTAGKLPDTLPFVSGRTRPGDYARTLVLGSTEHGNNAAVVLNRGDRQLP